MTVIWEGPESLRGFLVPIEELYFEEGSGEVERFAEGLRRFGQKRPVVAEEDTVVSGSHVVEAARLLGWTHVAVRVALIEAAAQVSLLDEAESRGILGGDELRSLVGEQRQATSADEVNAATSNPETEWVGLPEFSAVGEPFKLVVSCETERERDSLLDLLGIETIHKGTRGTLSTWWPERAKEDLSSLRFVVEQTESTPAEVGLALSDEDFLF